MRNWKSRMKLYRALLSLLTFTGSGYAGSSETWTETLAAAKKDGQVTIYIYQYEPAVKWFEKEFPEIKVNSLAAPGSQLGSRVVAERRGGKFIPDVFSSGANTSYNVLYKGKALDPIKPSLVLPEVVEQSHWYGGEHRYIDAEGKYIFAYEVNPSAMRLAYNETLVEPKEFKSYWDLLNSKWKGKIVSFEPTNTGIGIPMQFFFHHPDLGPEFIKRFFGRMDVTFSRDQRQMTDWLAQGKFALCLGCAASMARAQGLPIETLDTSGWKEGSAFGVRNGSLSLMNQAPHPNAAKVFINWFLSRKGQIALQKYGYPENPPNSRRIDIPKGDVPPDNRIVEGRKYLDVARPEYADMAPIFELAKSIMKSREQGK
jgi:iron(III) transport system substrate-binding protein